jgi:uncharacterized membrane protein YkvA (DUF1232 family)
MARRSPLRVGLGLLSLWPFLPLTSRAPAYGRLLIELVADSRVPWRSKAVLAGAAAYIASPIDLIPDFIPVISRLDDAVVLVLSVDFFLETIPRDVMVEKLYQLGIDGRELERDLESARRAVPRPIRLALRRLPSLYRRLSWLVRRELQGHGVAALLDRPWLGGGPDDAAAVHGEARHTDTDTPIDAATPSVQTRPRSRKRMEEAPA